MGSTTCMADHISHAICAIQKSLFAMKAIYKLSKLTGVLFRPTNVLFNEMAYMMCSLQSNALNRGHPNKFLTSF